MDPACDQNNAPDSWDQEINGVSGSGDQETDLEAQFNSLNVDAPTFVPGQNVHAAAFVMPSFGASNDDVPQGINDGFVV
jgi:hypothetical protein